MFGLIGGFAIRNFARKKQPIQETTRISAMLLNSMEMLQVESRSSLEQNFARERGMWSFSFV